MPNRPVGAKMFCREGRTDGRTDKSKLKVAFRSFANAPKNGMARAETSVYYKSGGTRRYIRPRIDCANMKTGEHKIVRVFQQEQRAC
jgi:hypothetical protein